MIVMLVVQPARFAASGGGATPSNARVTSESDVRVTSEGDTRVHSG